MGYPSVFVRFSHNLEWRALRLDGPNWLFFDPKFLVAKFQIDMLLVLCGTKIESQSMN